MLAWRAPSPKAEFAVPVVLEKSAAVPKAWFWAPVLTASADHPKAELPLAVVLARAQKSPELCCYLQ